ncbi:MAG: zinc ribbon domain-containing protein [Clostridia bacterium]|nr:zinc ribbon domain-containing protein [Clostridia bacterium]
MAYCSNCGTRIDDSAAYCPACGAPNKKQASPAAETAFTAPQENAYTPPQGDGGYGTRVTLCPDGKYRWQHDYNLFKDPTVFFLIWKIFFFIILGIFGFITILNLIEGNEVLGELKIFAYFIAGMTALVGISYLIYAAIMGGKYVVQFDMDEAGVNHRQVESQAKKARKIGAAAFLGGAASGSFTAMGAGIAATRTEMYSEFAKVRKVKGSVSRGVIKVNGRLNHNMVFVQKEDYEFVKQYIISHCPNLLKHN